MGSGDGGGRGTMAVASLLLVARIGLSGIFTAWQRQRLSVSDLGRYSSRATEVPLGSLEAFLLDGPLASRAVDEVIEVGLCRATGELGRDLAGPAQAAAGDHPVLTVGPAPGPQSALSRYCAGRGSPLRRSALRPCWGRRLKPLEDGMARPARADRVRPAVAMTSKASACWSTDRRPCWRHRGPPTERQVATRSPDATFPRCRAEPHLPGILP